MVEVVFRDGQRGLSEETGKFVSWWERGWWERGSRAQEEG